MKRIEEISLTLDSIARPLTQEEQGKYEDYIRSQNYNGTALKTLNVPLKQSNLFKVLLLNQIGIKTATLDEIEILVHSRPELLRDREESIPSVVLRSTHDSYKPNEAIFKSLARMFRRDLRKSRSFVISGLNVVGNDSDEVYGLGFEKGDDFKAVEIHEFSNRNHKRTFSVIENGIPMFDPNNQFYDPFLSPPRGRREFYSRPDGVSSLSLGGEGFSGSGFPYFAYWQFNLYSYNKNLDHRDRGPVIVVDEKEPPAYLSAWWRRGIESSESHSKTT